MGWLWGKTYSWVMGANPRNSPCFGEHGLKPGEEEHNVGMNHKSDYAL